MSRQNGIIVSGSAKTFLKSGVRRTSIPSGREGRLKNAKYTVFVRVLHKAKKSYKKIHHPCPKKNVPVYYNNGQINIELGT